MNFVGGYIMVDATGLDIHDTNAQTVSGLYNQLSDAIDSGKLIVLCGMDNDGTAVSPTPVSCTMGAGATITMSGFSAVVADDDEVTPVS